VLCASKEVDQKIKYTLMSHHQNAGQTHDIKTVIKSGENMENFSVPRNDVST
jgi:D-ribose pyranose/furanose isomerase RbsD